MEGEQIYNSSLMTSDALWKLRPAAGVDHTGLLMINVYEAICDDVFQRISLA